jgi:hypothetical protein
MDYKYFLQAALVCIALLPFESEATIPGIGGGDSDSEGGGLSSILGALGSIGSIGGGGEGGSSGDLSVPIAALKKLIIKKKILLLPHLLKRSRNPILRKLKLIKLLKLKKLILLKKKLLLLQALQPKGSQKE